jgi:purine-binding chemotaxis protein CheW
MSGKNNKNVKSSNFSRYSVFIISEKLFGIELTNVFEVITKPKISKIPGLKKNVVGVFNLRGTIITLLKINEIIGLESQESEDNMVLIIQHEQRQLGILVEKVLDVINVDETEIQLPKREMSARLANNIIGYYEKEGMGVINLINLNELLVSDNFS